MTGTRASYVLPIRWTVDGSEFDDLTAYLEWLSARCEVIVVDDSPMPVYDAHRRAWGRLGVHCPPDDDLRALNGKVSGVRTGMRRVATERVVIADDDVRYDASSLSAVIDGLTDADLVIPQNVFRPLPWHARWDTARSLINRAFGTDFPGTLALRRSAYRRAGGYDGDVLFENLELMRTLRAVGARERPVRSVFVVRRPPSIGRFWSQRIRQAYDSLAQPVRMVAELSLLPAGSLAVRRRGVFAAAAALLASWAVAEAGRRRDCGRQAFPATSALWAPAWLLERAVCSWLALGLRTVRGGITYAGVHISVAAHSRRELDRRFRDRRTAATPRRRRLEPGGDMPTVAERLDRRLPAPA